MVGLLFTILQVSSNQYALSVVWESTGTGGPYLIPTFYDVATMDGTPQSMRFSTPYQVYDPTLVTDIAGATLSNVVWSATDVTFSFLHTGGLPTVPGTFTMTGKSDPNGTTQTFHANEHPIVWWRYPSWVTAPSADPYAGTQTVSLKLNYLIDATKAYSVALIDGSGAAASFVTFGAISHSTGTTAGRTYSILTFGMTPVTPAAVGKAWKLRLSFYSSYTGLQTTLEDWVQTAFADPSAWVDPLVVDSVAVLGQVNSGSLVAGSSYGLGNRLRFQAYLSNEVNATSGVGGTDLYCLNSVVAVTPTNQTYTIDSGTNKRRIYTFDLDTRQTMDAIYQAMGFADGSMPATFAVTLRVFNVLDKNGNSHNAGQVNAATKALTLNVDPAAFYGALSVSWVSPTAFPTSLENGTTYSVRPNHKAATLNAKYWDLGTLPTLTLPSGAANALTATYDSGNNKWDIPFTPATLARTRAFYTVFDTAYAADYTNAASNDYFVHPLVQAFTHDATYTSLLKYNVPTQGNSQIYVCAHSLADFTNNHVFPPYTLALKNASNQAVGTVSSLAVDKPNNKISFYYNLGSTTLPTAPLNVEFGWSPNASGMGTHTQLTEIPFFGSNIAVQGFADDYINFTTQTLTVPLAYRLYGTTALTLTKLGLGAGGDITSTPTLSLVTEGDGRVHNNYTTTLTLTVGADKLQLSGASFAFTVTGTTIDGIPVTMTTTPIIFPDPRAWTNESWFYILSNGTKTGTIGDIITLGNVAWTEHVQSASFDLAWTTNSAAKTVNGASLLSTSAVKLSASTIEFDTFDLAKQINDVLAGVVDPGTTNVPLTLRMYDIKNGNNVTVVDAAHTKTFALGSFTVSSQAYTAAWNVAWTTAPTAEHAANQAYVATVTNYVQSYTAVLKTTGGTTVATATNLTLDSTHKVLTFNLDLTSVNAGNYDVYFTFNLLNGHTANFTKSVSLASSGFTSPDFTTTWATTLAGSMTYSGINGFAAAQSTRNVDSYVGMYQWNGTTIAPVLLPNALNLASSTWPGTAVCGDGTRACVAYRSAAGTVKLSIMKYISGAWTMYITDFDTGKTNASWGAQRFVHMSYDGTGIMIAGWGNSCAVKDEGGTLYATLGLAVYGFAGAISPDGNNIIAGQQYRYNTSTHVYEDTGAAALPVSTSHCMFSNDGLHLYAFIYTKRALQTAFNVWNRASTANNFSVTPDYEFLAPLDTDTSVPGYNNNNRTDGKYANVMMVDPASNVLVAGYCKKFVVYNYTHGTGSLGSVINTVNYPGSCVLNPVIDEYNRSFIRASTNTIVFTCGYDQDMASFNSSFIVSGTPLTNTPFYSY